MQNSVGHTKSIMVFLKVAYDQYSLFVEGECFNDLWRDPFPFEH